MIERVLVGHGIDSEATGLAPYLVAHGFEARAAYDGRTLLELAERWRPQAAIVELGLPGRSAFDVGRALQSRFRKQIRLIAITTPPAPHLRREAVHAGFDDFIQDASDLGEVVITLGGPGADLVKRAQRARYERARSMIGLARRHLHSHHRLVGPFERRQHLDHIHRAIEWVEVYTHMGLLEDARRPLVEKELAELRSLAAALDQTESHIL